MLVRCVRFDTAMKEFAQTWWAKIATPYMALVVALTLLASLAGAALKQLPVLSLFGALIIALLIGMLVQIPMKTCVIRGSVQRTRGIAGAAGLVANKLLRLGIILLGFKLNLQVLFTQGLKSIPLAIAVVALTIVGTYALARALGVSPRLAMLTAGGTAICGAAAVMAISGAMDDDEHENNSTERNGAGTQGLATPSSTKADDEVMAVATVAVMGTLFALIDIAVLPLLPLSATQRGIVAGASLHEIAHAVAAGDALGAVDVATIMKLSRVLMLVFAAICIALWWAKRTARERAQSIQATQADVMESGVMEEAAGETAQPAKKPLPIPWFMFGFIAASILGTTVPFLHAITAQLVDAGYIFLGMAMAALGMNVNFKAMLSHGRNAVLASFLASIVLLVSTIVVAWLLF